MYSIPERNKTITDNYEYINLTAKKYCNIYKIKSDDRYDAIQECFIKIILGLDGNKFDPEKSSIKTWIDRCINNCVIDYCKKNKRYFTYELKDSVVEFEDDLILDNILIDEILNTLNPTEKQIVKLKLQSYTSKEISEKLQLTDSNIRKIYSRLIKRINKNVT